MNTCAKLENFLKNVWNDYLQLNPSAKEVQSLLLKNNEKITNDHIAFRTFSHPDISASIMAEKFKQFGYAFERDYEFKAKKLKALHLEHFDVSKPKLFISEIDLNQLTPKTKALLEDCVLQIPEKVKKSDSLPFSGRPWEASYKTYLEIYLESEYAAWVYAHGFRPNHFTVYINELKQLTDIRKLNDFLKFNGFKLNSSGGEVKGSPLVLLEQSSTMASSVQVQFKEGAFYIPGGYYEFAKRYPMKNHKIFQGFVADSADKIFESTNTVDQLPFNLTEK